MRISDARARDALLREDFGFFLMFAFAELSGGRPYLHNWHIDAIIHQLDRLRFGENTRLITTMPPRHLKSIAISSAWVAWMLGKDPKLRFICASYGLELAEKHAADCLKLMDCEWYRRAFPGTVLRKRAVINFETSKGGGRRSTSVNGPITGLGADFIIIDDPLNVSDIYSEVARTKAKEWFWDSANQRLDDQDKGCIILVMQRLHEDDLAGDFLERGGWYELRLPAIATEDELVPLTRGRLHQRREGHALHPARRSLATLERLRRENPFTFGTQFQQAPVSRIGEFVHREWFGIFDEPPRSGTMILSCDTAVKTTVRSDWSVGIIACYYQGRYYILDLFRQRVAFGTLLELVADACRKYKVTRLLIEDTSSGQQLIQMLQDKPLDGVPRPIGVSATQEKIVRFEAQASRIQAGTVVLPRTAPWLADFIEEVIGFPNARHDDQADALAQMLANPPATYKPPVNDGPEIIFPDSPRHYGQDRDPWGP